MTVTTGLLNTMPEKGTANKIDGQFFSAVAALGEQVSHAQFLVMENYPFPCHARYKRVYLSPALSIISDFGYASKFTDETFAACRLTHDPRYQSWWTWTLYIGIWAIKESPPILPGLKGCLMGDWHDPINRNEEHWIFGKWIEGLYEDQRPSIGSVLYIFPHIPFLAPCIRRPWLPWMDKLLIFGEVTARNRKLSYREVSANEYTG